MLFSVEGSFIFGYTENEINIFLFIFSHYLVKYSGSELIVRDVYRFTYILFGHAFKKSQFTALPNWHYFYRPQPGSSLFCSRMRRERALNTDTPAVSE